MKYKSCFIALFLLAAWAARAQQLSGIATRWSDSFGEWVVFAEEEEESGELRLRWIGLDNWTEWEYRLGESTGQIKLKWNEDPNEWEIRGDNRIISARTLFNGDFREWRITDNDRQLTFSSRYGNSSDHWALRESDYGYFSIYTAWEGDPRDWVVEDELDPAIDLPMKMALVFIAIYQSILKE